MKIDRELLECAKINFENLEHVVSAIKQHPFYIIAKHQLDEALGYPGHPELQDKNLEDGVNMESMIKDLNEVIR